MLPPQNQLSYNPKDGVGKVKLIFGCNYLEVGGFAVKVGRSAFKRCITALSKADELHDTEEGQKILAAGPLALPMVVISKAIRFGLWRACVTKRLGEEEVDDVVEEEHSQYFQVWKKMSVAIVSKDKWNNLEVKELVKLVRVLMRNKEIKPEKKKWAPRPSSSTSAGKK